MCVHTYVAKTAQELNTADKISANKLTMVTSKLL